MRLDPRSLHLKIRVILTRQMSSDEARLLLNVAVTTGQVPPGIRVESIDWGKGDQDGVRDPVQRVDLRKFAGAVVHDQAKRRFALAIAKPASGLPPASERPKRPKRKASFRDRSGRYRDAKGRFISKIRWLESRARFTDDEEDLLHEMRARLRGKVVGVGSEFELTLTTEGGTPLATA